MKRRRPLGTLCEIFLPVLLTSILIFVREEVEITQEPVTYGQSIPIFSIFDVDGLPVSLPGTLDSQDICLGGKINKFIAVTPDDENTRWFLGHLEEYYEYVSNNTLLSYYNLPYFLDDVDNFRDLFILINDTLDLCVNISNYTCQSFIEVLDVGFGPFSLDIYDDEQMEALAAIIDLSVFGNLTNDFVDFVGDLIDALNTDENNDTIIEFNTTNPDTIAEILEFVKSSF